MPPRKKKLDTPIASLIVQCYSRGSGMTTGLELWSAKTDASAPPKFLLFDRSSDGRFATDVSMWNGNTGIAPAVLVGFAAAAAATAPA